MNTIDCGLSGFALHNFERVAQKLFALKTKYKIIEVQIWDLSNGFDRTSFGDGTDLKDANDILEFDFTKMKRLALIFQMRLDSAKTNITIQLCRWSRGCVLEGQVYLGDLVTERNGAVRRLEFLAEFVTEIAKASDAVLLSLVDEDCDDMLLDALPVKKPWLFAVLQAKAFPTVFAMTRTKSDIAVFWLQSPQSFLDDELPDEQRERELRSGLAAGIELLL